MNRANSHRQQRTTEAVQEAIRRSGTINWKPLLFQVSLLGLLLASLLILLVLLTDVVIGSIPTFATRGFSFVTDGLSLRPETAGVATGIGGSIIIALFVALLAFPIGIAAAVYVEEYAPRNRMTQMIDTTVRNLAGVPSIVYGLLGLAMFVPFVAAIGLGGTTQGRNVIAAGITMAVLVLPIVIITSAEAIRSVPSTIREAGYGVGATRWEVVRSHVLPSAAPGILTGTVLTLARAVGDVAAPLLVIGVATGFFVPPADATIMDRLTGTYTALPVTVFSWSRQTDPAFTETLAPAAIVVLLVVLFALNGVAIFLRNRTEQRW